MEKKKSLKRKHFSKEECQLWKERYDTLEERHEQLKIILKKALNDVKEESEKQKLVRRQYDKLRIEMIEKEKMLDRIRSVSEAVIDEYNVLKAKYEMESEAAANALKVATKYCHENQVLKTQSVLVQNPASSETEALEQDYSVSEVDNQVEALHKAAADCRGEVACFKTKLEKEVEKQKLLLEDLENAKNLYEDLVVKHKAAELELKTLKNDRKSGTEDSSINFPKTGLEDIKTDSQLQTMCDNSLPTENIESKRNSNDCKLVAAVKELEDLSLKFEDTVWHHQLLMEDKQKDMDEVQKELAQTVNRCITLEKSLEEAEQRAYTYERKSSTLEHRIQELECQLQRSNAGLPPLSLPPPPPPLPPPTFNPIRSLMTFIHAGRKVAQYAPKKEKQENQQQKAMNEMINAIKKGNIQLKPTPKCSATPADDESAVGEMMGILSSLKKKRDASSSTQEENSVECGSFDESVLIVKIDESEKEEDSELDSVTYRKKSSGCLLRDGETSLRISSRVNSNEILSDTEMSDLLNGGGISATENENTYDDSSTARRTSSGIDQSLLFSSSEKEFDSPKRFTYNVNASAFDKTVDQLKIMNLNISQNKKLLVEKESISSVLNHNEVAPNNDGPPLVKEPAEEQREVSIAIAEAQYSNLVIQSTDEHYLESPLI